MKINNFLNKIDQIKKEHKLDLSSSEDLSIAIMNLVSLEEHFYFTAKKTNKDKYFDLQEKARNTRKELLKMIVKDKEGEVWCISKHLLAASMRLIEVGTKYYSENKQDEAKKLFSKAYELYSLFFEINLGIVDIGEVKKIESNKINKKDNNNQDLTKKLNKLVQDLIDCCDE